MNYNKDTIDSYYLYIRNPSQAKGYGYSLWVRHKDGLEYPFIDADPFTVVNSIDEEFSYTEPVKRSDLFGHALSGCLVHSVVNKEILSYKPLLPDKLPDQERWLVSVILEQVARGRIPFELEELLERVLDDRVVDMVGELKSAAVDRGEKFVE